jgi:hypothetical protein
MIPQCAAERELRNRGLCIDQHAGEHEDLYV